MLLIIGIIVCIVACWLWVKFVFAIFRMIAKKKVNPYIEAQKNIEANNKNYEDYLLWMDKKGSGVPLEKIKTIEEEKAENQYKKLI
jgi:hypothetical protein